MRTASVLSSLTVASLAVLYGCTDRSGLSIGFGDAGFGGSAGSGGVFATGGAAGATKGSGGNPWAAGGTTATAGTQGAGGFFGSGGTSTAGTKGGLGGIVAAGGTKGGLGGAIATGGTTFGAGGTKADAGTSKDAGKDTVPCGPVCLILCLYGNVLDSNGCPTCACNPPPDAAPDLVVPPDVGVICPAIKCKACPFGYVKDASGCDTCTCAADPNAACSSFTTQSTCASATRCQWLEPGCDSPALSASGCYDEKLVNCQNNCPDGLSCLQRSIDPCPNGNCLACGQTISLCL